MKSLRGIVVLASVLVALLAQRASAQYQWHRAVRGAFQGIAFNPLSKGETIFVASYDSLGIFRSDDHGQTWARYYTGLEQFATSDIRQILCVPTDTNVVLAVSPRKLYRSTDGGRSWTEVPMLGGIEGEDIDYQASTDILYYGQNFKGPTWKSTDHGANWTVTGDATDSIGLCTIAVSPDVPTVLLAGSQGGEIARSTQEGMNWTIQKGPDTGAALEPEVPKIVYSKVAINASGVRAIALGTRWLSRGDAIVKTTDNGVTWTSLHHPSKNPWALDIDQRSDMIAKPSDAAYPGPLHFWTGLFHDRSDTATNGLIQETTDGGITWHSTNFPRGVDGDPANPLTRDVWVMKFDTTSGRLIASTSTGVWMAETKSGVATEAPEQDIDIRITATSIGVDNAQHLTLFDILGRVVRSSDGASIAAPDAHGYYTLRVTDRDRTLYRRLIF